VTGSHLQISPSPSDEETAAIVAAVEAAQPQLVLLPPTPIRRNTSWKFSNRWWAKPLAARRDRPFL
jgi:hypothetical protein